jgi:multidrug transporter EmrE-like cation transporter
LKAAYAYALVFLTVAFTVYGQFIIKWQVLKAGALPPSLEDRLLFVLRLLLNPWIISALAAAFVASVAWMLAMTRLDISRAFPLTSTTFVCIIFGGALLFHEPITSPKVIGACLVILGIIVGSQG